MTASPRRHLAQSEPASGRPAGHVRLTAAVAAFLCLNAAPPAHGQTDQDIARQALLAHRAVPLGHILDRLTAEHPGNLLDIRLFDSPSGLFYTLRLMTPGGRIEEWQYDAQTSDPRAGPVGAHPSWRGGG